MSTEQETLELKKEKRSKGTSQIDGLAAEEKKKCKCFRELTRLQKSLLACSLILIILALAIIFETSINKNYGEYDSSSDACGPGGDAELLHYSVNVSSVMVDEFQFDMATNFEETYFLHSFHLCFMNLSVDYHKNGWKYIENKRVVSSLNYSYCSYYCKNIVFGFNTSFLSIDCDKWCYSQRAEFKPHYYYYNSKDELCYCQGYPNIDEINRERYDRCVYHLRWSNNAIDTLWKVYEYKYVYNYNYSNDSNYNRSHSIPHVNMSDLVSIKMFGDGGAICNQSNGDIWINYTDINDLNISYLIYDQDWYRSHSNGRPYFIKIENGQQVSTVANSKVYQSSANPSNGDDVTSVRNWWKLSKKNSGNITRKWQKNSLTENISTVTDRIARTVQRLEFTEEERSIVVNGWYNEGLKEHASIASFGVNGIKLISIGAPSYLLKMNYQAILDEIEHTKICLTISDYYNNSGWWESSSKNTVFKIPSSIDAHSIEIKGDTFDSWNEIAVETAEHGCIDETISALMSYCKAMLFSNSTYTHTIDQGSKYRDNINLESGYMYDFKSLLHQIATDESRHAAFAWNTLKWIQIYKSNQLDVFNQQWWQNELSKRVDKISIIPGTVTGLGSSSSSGSSRSSCSNEKIDQRTVTKLESFGILSSCQKKHVFLVSLKQMIPQLLNQCLLNKQSVENSLCVINIINQFMDDKSC